MRACEGVRPQISLEHLPYSRLVPQDSVHGKDSTPAQCSPILTSRDRASGRESASDNITLEHILEGCRESVIYSPDRRRPDRSWPGSEGTAPEIAQSAQSSSCHNTHVRGCRQRHVQAHASVPLHDQALPLRFAVPWGIQHMMKEQLPQTGGSA